MPYITIWSAVVNVKRDGDDAESSEGYEHALFEATTNTHEALNDA